MIHEILITLTSQDSKPPAISHMEAKSCIYQEILLDIIGSFQSRSPKALESFSISFKCSPFVTINDISIS